jgi:galactoside O-acetyltransferase
MFIFKFSFYQIIEIIRVYIVRLRNNYFVFKKFRIILSEGRIINNSANIILGLKFRMAPNCQLIAQGQVGDAQISIGGNVALNMNVIINADCGGRIIIGNDVMIGPNTVMRASNHKFNNLYESIINQGHVPGEIHIEDDVWIGANVSIVPNVRIGKSSVIGAGSVVCSNIPPFSVAVGNPAKVIKIRH